MAKKSTKVAKTSSKIKVIYNPNAGKKRKLVQAGDKRATLEDVKLLLSQYQIEADFSPTSGPGDATKLAAQAAKSGYKMVIGAGGDGTISEVANGLINTDVQLGILPMGSFMNTARMLSIPTDLEAAVQILKIGRVRKIDVGSITAFDGEKLLAPVYFLESAGLGIEAEFHRYIAEIEKGQIDGLWSLLKLPYRYANDLAIIKIDGKEIKTRATLVTISNGPFTGAALPIAPDAKLNDHLLTVSFYRMSKWELVRYFWKNSQHYIQRSRKVEVHQGKEVKIDSNRPKLVHADATIFGKTPVVFKIIPNALNVISGFPKPGEAALMKRTILDP